MIKLPEPAAVESTHGCNAKGPYQHHTFYYTADQLKQAIRDALEEAAKVADSMAPEFGEKGWAAKERGDFTLSLGMLGVEFQLKECAAAIRKLKEDIQ